MGAVSLGLNVLYGVWQLEKDWLPKDVGTRILALWSSDAVVIVVILMEFELFSDLFARQLLR